MNILVYEGEGTDGFSVTNTVYTLKQFLSENYDVIKVDEKLVISQPWQKSTQLFVIPGGRDLYYLKKLGETGTQKIKDYVNNMNGKYLGICAGAYFGSSELEFEKDRKEYSVVGKRPLQFFKGVAKGSALSHFTYNSNKGASAAEVQLSFLDRKAYLYHNGGCYFDVMEDDENVMNETQILGRYNKKCNDGKINAPAIVECINGNGMSILSGVHFEYAPELLEKRIKENETNSKTPTRPEVIELVKKIQETNEVRIQLIKTILEKLGLKINKKINRNNLITLDKDIDILVTAINENLFNNISNELQLNAINSPKNENKFNIFLNNNTEKIIKENTSDIEEKNENINLCLCEKSKIPKTTFKLNHFMDNLIKNYNEKYELNYLKNNFLPGSIVLFSELVSSTQTILKK